ncbi:MAG: hypothetical protein JXQ27_02160 [Acidobacteria bacterium]|nr:hypothetical protein [Acidobacteriota bacterium]
MNDRWFWLAGLILWVWTAGCQTTTAPPPVEDGGDIHRRIAELRPDEADFAFTAPLEWGANLVAGAHIVAVSPGEDPVDAGLLADGSAWTTWQSRACAPPPEILLDLGRTVTIARLVFFNRHTDARGTGGGNNAARHVELAVATESAAGPFRVVDTFELAGPRPHCIPMGQGQLCFFIDRTEPSMFKIELEAARYVRLRLLSAYWEADIPADWRSSVALSELMLFGP